MVITGLERLLQSGSYDYSTKRLGYLSNQASTTRELLQGRVPLQEKYGQRLTTLFSPQHGFHAEKQDNMIESDHQLDTLTGLQIYSLYGEHRRPTAAMLDEIDVLLVDLVDVGTRVYTFIYTMGYCLEEAAAQGKTVVILDRPNPLGGLETEGNLVQPDCHSFVGLYPLPMRHGLTVGELALWLNAEMRLGAELEVVPMTGWQRQMLWQDQDFPWLAPSPNMPTPDTALVYPGQVLWEGTEASEGRGTTRPFEYCGAPYWQPEEILAALAAQPLPGCTLRPIEFAPTSGKYAGETCRGFQTHITAATKYKPYRTSLALLQAVMTLYPNEFHYKAPPYEYEYQRLPMDLLVGDRKLREGLEAGTPVMELEREWQAELVAFTKNRAQYFLY